MSQRNIGGIIYNPPAGWSGYFDGSGDYLYLPNNSALSFGTGDFCVEAYVYKQRAANEPIIDSRATNNASPWALYIDGSNFPYFYDGTSYTSTLAVTLNAWIHVAVTRSSGTLRIFVNGVQGYSATVTTNLDRSGGNQVIGATVVTFANTWLGYMSNLRIVKGSAVYTANFTPPTGALQPISGTSLLTCRYPTFVDGSTNAFTITVNGNTAVNTLNPFPTSGIPTPALGNAGNGIYTLSQYATLLAANSWPAIDPYYKNVTLNLHGNPVASGTFITDASTNNFGLTIAGDTRADSRTPFAGNGYYSNYFDGSGDYLSFPTVANPTTGDFTIEFWAYNSGAWSTNFDFVDGTSGALGIWTYSSTLRIGIQLVGGTKVLGSLSSTPLNQWLHFAIIRVSGNTRAYVNGTALDVAQADTNSYSGFTKIAGNTDGYFTGYISNFRYVNSAIYSISGSTITVPTSPLTAVSGTQLLTCQSNRFIDNSTNAFAITANGNTAVNALQPFATPSGISTYGSGYFDGTGDYLTVTGSALDASTTTDYTVEFWMYTAKTGSAQMIYELGTGVTNDLQIYVSTTALVFQVDGNSPTATVSFTDNSWVNVACVKAGGTLTTYINGVGTTVDTGVTVTSKTTAYIGMRAGTSLPFAGYLSNMRVTRAAVYTSNFTPSTTPLTAITNTSLLTLQTNNPVNNNTILDSSPNNYTITRTGSITQGSFTPYLTDGYWSNYFDGVSDYLSIADNAAFDLGTGDFTLETWVYHTTTSGTLQVYYSHRTNGLALTRNTSGYLEVAQDAVAVLLTSITTVPSNQWVHVATSRSGTSLKLFINGVVSGSTVNSTSLTSSNPVYIGSDYSSAYEFTGYISNMRLIKGTAIYTDSFTPSTAPLTAITNTSLLTCQSNRFKDNSANAFSITKTGDVNVQRFQPFRLPSTYTTSAFSGSGYFFGASNQLTTPSGTCPVINNFSASGWIYRTSVPGYQQTFIALGIDGAGRVGFFWTGSNFQYNIYGSSTVTIDGSGSMPVGAWTYVVLTRTSSTLTLYYNGTLIATVSLGTAFSASSGRSMGWLDGTIGYATNLRFDTAAYATPTVVPTAPVSYTVNTNNLLNFTNAGIFDDAMQNALVTVGNAQISTSVKKYGTGSMYFDGTGDWLACPPEPVQFGTGSFTIEAWVYPTASRYNPIITRNWTGNNKLILAITSSGAVDVWVGHATSGYYQGTSSAVCSTLNTWYHIALVRNGSTITCYVNGSYVLTGSCTATMTDSNTNLMYIGYYLGDGSTFQGYIDDLRITKGVARYTANFTPPTSQVQDQ